MNTMKINTIKIDDKWENDDLIVYVITYLKKKAGYTPCSFLEPYEDDFRIIWGEYKNTKIEKISENEVRLSLDGNLYMEFLKKSRELFIPLDIRNLFYYMDIHAFFKSLGQLSTHDFRIATVAWDSDDNSYGAVYVKRGQGVLNYLYIPRYSWHKLDIFWEIAKYTGIQIERQQNDDAYDNESMKIIYDLKWGVIGNEIERKLREDATFLAPDWF